jgi:hypothetical protein
MKQGQQATAVAPNGPNSALKKTDKLKQTSKRSGSIKSDKDKENMNQNMVNTIKEENAPIQTAEDVR